MQTKSLIIEKMDEAGSGLARIAILSAIDHDGDTYQPGAFGWKDGGEQWVMILPAHDRRAMPLGKARVYEDGDFVYAQLFLNLATQAGRDWHEALKFDLANGKAAQEWSYGFDVIDATYDQRDGDRVRVLKRLDVQEVSPVLRGAGVGTGTVMIKGAALRAERFSGLLADLGEIADAVTANPSIVSATGAKQLAEIHVAVGKAIAATKGYVDCGESDELTAAATAAVVAGWLKQMSRRQLPDQNQRRA